MVLACLFGLAGCVQPIRTWQPPRDPDELSATAFIHYLETVPWATWDEGARAVLLLLEDGHRFTTPSDRRAELVRRGAIRAGWGDAPDRILDRGTLAYMLRRICRVAPSTNEILLGTWGVGDRRYALRACVDAGIMTYGPTHDPVSGGELLATIRRSDEYLDRHRPPG